MPLKHKIKHTFYMTSLGLFDENMTTATTESSIILGRRLLNVSTNARKFDECVLHLYMYVCVYLYLNSWEFDELIDICRPSLNSIRPTVALCVITRQAARQLGSSAARQATGCHRLRRLPA